MKQPWHTAADGDVAKQVTLEARKRETRDADKRWRFLVQWRHFFGRFTCPSMVYAQGNSADAVSLYRQFDFQSPIYNIIAECADTYVNKILRDRVYVDVIPDSGSEKQRLAAKSCSKGIETGFDLTHYFSVQKDAGVNAMWAGVGYIKWSIVDGTPTPSAPFPADVLFASNDRFAKQVDAMHVTYVDRWELWTQFDGNKDAQAAIETAPHVHAGFWLENGNLDTSDVVALVDAYYAPRGKKSKGRHVLAIGNFALTDEKWADPLPLQQISMFEIPDQLDGQGIAERLLEISSAINDRLAAVEENYQRGGGGKWLVPVEGTVNIAALGSGSQNAVSFSGGPNGRPHLEQFATTHQADYQHVETLIAYARNLVHISEAGAKGEAPPGIKSGVALTRYLQVAADVFTEVGKRLEDLTIESAYHFLRLSKRARYDFDGQKILDYDTLTFENGRPFALRAYGAGRLPQEPAGRQQFLDAQLADGKISKQIHTFFSSVPDVNALEDQENAPIDAVNIALDELVTGTAYNPPLPFMDKAYALKAVEARHSLESIRKKTPQTVLDRLLDWRAGVLDLIEQEGEAAPPAGVAPGAPAAPAGTFGDLQGPNPAAAPSPPTSQPNLPAPPG